MANDDVPELFIPLGTCEEERFCVLPPVTHSFTKGDSEIEWCTSEGRYINDDGIKCEAYFELPEQYSFGTNACYPMTMAKEEKTPANMTGIQICYPMTTMKTIENPMKSEKDSQYVFDCLRDVTWKKMKELCDDQIDDDDRKVPAPTYASYVTATRGKTVDISKAVKPPYSFPMVTPKGQKKKVEDRSKPQRAYIKFMTKGEGRDMRCITSVYGPGDKKVSALKYIDVKGKATPVVKWEGVFWGSHGQKAPYGASVRLRVAEMNFTPVTDGGPRRRMLGPNLSVPEEDDISDDEDTKNFPQNQGNEQDEGFVRPEGDEDPSEMLGKEENPHEEENQFEELPKKKKTTLTSSKRKELLEKKRKANK